MRVALVTNFCLHYRRPLFLEMSRRMDLTLILTSRGNEWYWQGPARETDGVPTVFASGPVKTRRELRAGGKTLVVSNLTGSATLLAAVRTSRALLTAAAGENAALARAGAAAIVPAGDPATLAAACARLLDSPAARGELAERGAAYAREALDPAIYARALVHKYLELARDGS